MGMNDVNFRNKIEHVATLMKKAKRLFIITGAGISADSGLPTYRGISGLYENKQTDEGIPIEVALSGSTLEAEPALTWKYLAQIEETCRGRSYNRAHEILAEMQDFFDGTWILTQNVDGFHHQAGSKNVIDIHGNLHDLVCRSCGYEVNVRDYSGLLIPPPCPQCNGMLRPDVVLFEEMLSPVKIQQLNSALQAGFDLLFTIGTSSVFPYISHPVVAAYQTHIPTVEINPGQTRVSDYCHVKIQETAATTLSAIWAMFRH
jgi:NAD-dependent deacetylase